MKRVIILASVLILGLQSFLHAGKPPSSGSSSSQPPDRPEPDDFLPFFQFTLVSAAPVEQCCREPEPDVVVVRGTGEMTWAPWEYELLPCDYGEKLVDPADKSCRTVNDCTMLPVSWDCCGSLFLTGINKRQARRYLLLNHRCRRVLNWCDCPPGAYHAEDFKTSDDPADIRLECRRGQCRTFLKGD